MSTMLPLLLSVGVGLFVVTCLVIALARAMPLD